VVQLAQIGASQVPEPVAFIFQSHSTVAGLPQAQRWRGPRPQTMA
jgi:hypothetical protein